MTTVLCHCRVADYQLSRVARTRRSKPCRDRGDVRHGAFWPRRARAVGYAQAVGENPRIERGWIFVNGTRRDDGTIELGTGDEMRLSPFDAMSDRQDTHITWAQILKASVQRLAFWRR